MIRRSAAYMFIAFFLLALLSAAGIQVIFEQIGDKQIGAFNLFADTFIEPHRRQKRIASQLSELDSAIGKIEKLIIDRQTNENADAEMSAEEMAFIVQDIGKEARSINRHVDADTSGRFFDRLDTLTKLTEELYYSMGEKQNAAGAESLLTQIKNRADKLSNGWNEWGLLGAPILVVNNLLRYTFFNRTYLREYEAALEENSIVAKTCRPVMRHLRYVSLRDYGDKAVTGRNGWLFYKPGVDYLVKPSVHDHRSALVGDNEKPYNQRPVETIKNFQKQLSSRGIDLLVVIVPGKPTVYPDLLTKKISPDQKMSLTHSKETIEKLKAEGVDVVDLFIPFGNERLKDRSAGDSLYLRTDTHWKTRGSRLAAKRVAERIRQYSWFDTTGRSVEYVIDTVEVQRDGDIGEMTKLSDFKHFGSEIKFPAETTECHQVHSIKRDAEGKEIGRSLYRDDYRNSPILILGDSFSRIYQTDSPRGAGWISHLAYELGIPSASIISNGGASTLVREKLARKASILNGKRLVIWQFVERDLRFGAKGWKDVAVIR